MHGFESEIFDEDHKQISLDKIGFDTSNVWYSRPQKIIDCARDAQANVTLAYGVFRPCRHHMTQVATSKFFKKSHDN